MSFVLDREKLETAFQGRADLIGAIGQAASAPNWIELFNEISNYVCALRSSSTAAELKAAPQASGSSTATEPVTKKRKIEDESSTIAMHGGSTSAKKNGAAASAPGSTANGGRAKAEDDGGGADEEEEEEEAAMLAVKEISVVLPQRKKFSIEFTEGRIRAKHPDTGEVIPGSSCAWSDIAYAFCLPVPEKSQKQYNYILFPTGSNITTSSTSSSRPTNLPKDPLVFTIPATAPKAGTITGREASTATSTVGDTYKDLFDYYINRGLKSSSSTASAKALVEANPKLFASVQKEAHRPNEKAVHVKGFRGSKDGYLFFLPNGILWGFKKPFLFLPKERIVSVSYTSVLQRTFNLNVEVFVDEPHQTLQGAAEEDDEAEDSEEFEFAMLDQEDFEGIDTYVKRNGLQDASMAEQRRAKRLGINMVKNEDGTKVDVGDAGELAKAGYTADEDVLDEDEVERRLQDEEDEEEEDYDPGSAGESEGEGSSSEEEEEEDGDEDEAEVEGEEDEEDEEE